jgi:hypothetical protein
VYLAEFKLTATTGCKVTATLPNMRGARDIGPRAAHFPREATSSLPIFIIHPLLLISGAILRLQFLLVTVFMGNNEKNGGLPPLEISAS